MKTVPNFANFARESAARLIRQFLAVLFSFLNDKNPNILQLSMATPDTYSIQFPGNTRSIGYGSSLAFIGELLPPLLNDVSISIQDLDQVNIWYKKHAKADEKLRHRATKSSQFIQYASISKDIEKFIYYFIALDALFGERNRVEKNIKEGLIKIFKDINWERRTEYLYDLRNELLHGSSSYIEEWTGIEHYENFYNSDPIKDIQIAGKQMGRP